MANWLSYSTAILCSVLLHLGVAVLVANKWSAEETERKIVAPKYIDAKLLQLKEKEKPKPKKDNSAAKRREQLAREKAAREKAAREKAAKEKAAREKAAREKKAREKAARDKAAKEKAAREKAAREKAAREAAQRKALEDELFGQLDEDIEGQIAENDEQVASSYLAIIQRRVSSNWNRPPSARRGMEAELIIQLSRSGDVRTVRIVKKSGNEAFDRSVEQAVQKAGSFPELKNLEHRVFDKYFRNLPMVFRPEDLRK